jgi:hypothetical protein
MSCMPGCMFVHLTVQIHATQKGDYARVDGGNVCDGVKAVESTRGCRRWDGKLVVPTMLEGLLGDLQDRKGRAVVQLLACDVCWQPSMPRIRRGNMCTFITGIIY